jgi:2,4-dienoyl-CoA reductase-like NADH-dependent reductase (Old Yellow Enzyme family)
MHLFHPLTVGNIRVPNRIAMTAMRSGHASADGFMNDDLCAYYGERAKGGVGLVVLEPVHVIAPEIAQPHLGLYDDALIPSFRHCVDTVHQHDTRVLVMLDQALPVIDMAADDLRMLADAWTEAAMRVHATGADGVMLSCADGGPFDQLISRTVNRRTDAYGGNNGRTQLLLEVIEDITNRSGKRMIIGVRLNVGESVAGGLSLQDARVIAKRLAGAGVRLLEIGCETDGDTPLARFPGWCVPLAAAIKAVVDVPIMVGGLLADPELADSVIADGSADLVALGESLRAEPRWPHYAHSVLFDREQENEPLQ